MTACRLVLTVSSHYFCLQICNSFLYIIVYMQLTQNFFKLVLLLSFSARCPNCRVVTSGGLCQQCMDRRQCDRCGRHLCDGLFDGTASVCKTCFRKQNAMHVNQTAFGTISRETHLATTTGDVDLKSFVKENTPEIRRHVQDGIDKHE